MKTIKHLLLPVLFLFPYTAPAQKKTGNDRIHFSSQQYFGLLEGSYGTSFQLQTVNGLRYKTWVTGIGAGIDYYYQRTVPLFLSVGKFLADPKLPFYFNADIGINIPWQKDVIYINYPGEFSSSLYWAGGLGYKFSSKKNEHGFMLNLGYSFKRIIQENKLIYPCFNPPCQVDKEIYNYRLNRILLKLGWMF